MYDDTKQNDEGNTESTEIARLPLQQPQAHQMLLGDKHQNNSDQKKGKRRVGIGMFGWLLFILAIISSALGFHFFITTGNVLVVAVFNAPLIAIIAAYFQSHFRT